MLTDAALKCLKPKAKMYKVSDRDGMYVRVAPSGAISFRLDYRLNGRRETVYLGRYARDGISLARARELCIDARRAIAEGRSPAIEKQREKRRTHNVYLCRQTLDIMIALKTCSGNSRYLLPSRYDADAPMSRATFNRVTYAVV
jgi:hypothetical protein